jgi:hypothetical protein
MIYDFDGYEDYPTAQLGREHVRVEIPANVSVVSGGRNGGSRLACVSNGSNLGTTGRVVRAMPTVATLCWGHYLMVTSLATTVWLYDLRDATVSHVLIVANVDGSLAAYRSTGTNNFDFGSNGATLGNSAVLLGTTAAGTILAGEEFALKAKVTVDDASGVIELYVNGVQVLTLTGQDTRNSGTATITNLLHGAGRNGGAGSATVYYDDFWAGSTVLPGDRRVDSHYPIQDGAETGFTPSSGTDHYAMVDEASPDDDTSKVTAVTPGLRDTYKVEAFKNPGGSIDAVKTVLTCKKVAPNSAQLATCIYSNAAPHDGTAQGLTTTWMNVGEVAEVDPGTSAAWAENAFGAAGTADFGQHKAA